jgi:putative ABC transport system ATP-binding protein
MRGIECIRIVRDFATPAGAFRVLHGVDFHARAGQMTMLVGPSGCGKTTLISVIAGLLTATDGRVRVFDRDLTGMKSRELLGFRLRHIGFVFQQFNLINGLTATENAAVPLVAAEMPWPTALEKAAEMLTHLGLKEHVDKIPSQLSGGQQQRVAIARALVHDPDLLLCDEPTAALDGQSGQTVMQLLRELAVQPNRAAIIVTHDPRVFGFADRIAYMEDGLIVRTELAESPGCSP